MGFQVRGQIAGVLAAALVALAAFGLGSMDETEARFQGGIANCNPYTTQGAGTLCFYTVVEHGIDPTVGTEPEASCREGTFAGPLRLFQGSEVMGVGESILICVNTSTENRQYSKLTFDSNGVGRFDRAACGHQGDNSDGDNRVAEWPDDACLAVSGNNTSQLVIEQTINGLANDLATVIIRYTCPATPASTRVVITHSEGGPGNTATGAPGTTFDYAVDVHCRGLATQIPAMTAIPSTVEIIPARSNTSHSLISVTIADAAGRPVAPGHEIQFTTDRCSIEVPDLFADLGNDVRSFDAAIYNIMLGQVLALNPAAPATYRNWEFDDATLANVDANRQSDVQIAGDHTAADGTVTTRAAAILGCNPVDAPGVTPGVANVTACVSVPGPDICRTVQVTVIGPPAAITVTAAPATVRCGERVTLTATVRDSIGQNVSDHTRVEIITNLGGVLAGTGAVAGFAGPVVPISSTVGETFGGIATAFLLTSETHSGPYELVVTSGGTVATDPNTGEIFNNPTLEVALSALTNVLGGQFSTPPVNAFAQVSCTVPAAAAAAPTVTAPTTGGGIVPPSTGDAGLATSGGTSLVLVALAGALVVAAMGALGLKVLRR